MSFPEHRIWAEIHLDRIEHNLSRIQQTVGSETGIVPVVKANAYGHGAVEVAQTCSKHDVNMFGVASIKEAIQLREAGIQVPILVVGEILVSNIPDMVRHNIRPTVQSMSTLEQIGRHARRMNSVVPVHVAVDTGMRRLGTDSVEEGLEVAQSVKADEGLELEGASTHLSSAYESEGERFTKEQLSMFNTFLSRCRNQGIRFQYVHAANSGGIFSYPESHYDLVRPGIALYGVTTGNLSSRATDLKPALSLHTRLLHIKEVEPGEPIGYGRSHRVDDQTSVGVLPAGYHDGYPFQLSNGSRVLIKGVSCPVIGRVTMDYIMVDLDPLEHVDTGERVTLIGEDGDEQITAQELSDRAGTISYEMLCSIGDRVQRIYKSSID